MNDGQLEVYIRKLDEPVKMSTTATFLHNIEVVAAFWNRYSYESLLLGLKLPG